MTIGSVEQRAGRTDFDTVSALRTIEPGAELAYDYQYERTGKNDAELEKFYVCKCGAPNCRGSIMKPAKRKRSRPRSRK